MLKARLTEEPNGDVCLATPYHAELVSWLKTLPSGTRQWDPDRRRWLISALYAAEVLAALEEYQFTVQDDRASTGLSPAGDDISVWSPAGLPRDLAEAFHVLGLCGSAPLELAEIAWKFWIKIYHEDVGGTFEVSAQLNAAITTIRKYLKE